MMWTTWVREMRVARGWPRLTRRKPHPADKLFVVKDADDVLGAALRVVDGDARVLAFDNAIQGFVEGEIGGQGKKYPDGRP